MNFNFREVRTVEILVKMTALASFLPKPTSDTGAKVGLIASAPNPMGTWNALYRFELDPYLFFEC
jgi:hypothetical protein